MAKNVFEIELEIEGKAYKAKANTISQISVNDKVYATYHNNREGEGYLLRIISDYGIVHGAYTTMRATMKAAILSFINQSSDKK